jgi:ATP-dependent DNA helicase RecQ
VTGGARTDDELRAAAGMSHIRVTRTVSRLVDVGWAALDAAGSVTLLADPDVPAAQRAVAAAEQQRHDIERSRVEMMAAYAEHRHCRRAWLLGYFGEPYSPPCHHCDNCDAGRGVAPDTGADHPFPVGARVRHTSFGGGVVEAYDAITS